MQQGFRTAACKYNAASLSDIPTLFKQNANARNTLNGIHDLTLILGYSYISAWATSACTLDRDAARIMDGALDP